ncbi:MAG: hypothetical protein IKU02_02320 [Bacteroidaceae bacterium]|nr:hypothetical protein [Bacteroidaceae bacterium]
MKLKYKAPQMIQIEILTKHLVSESTTSQDVWTDDPQDPGGALTKEIHNRNLWDDEW